MKVKINTKLCADGSQIQHQVFGIFRDYNLIFWEDKVKVSFNFQEQTMIRDDDVKKLWYKFVENEKTLNEVLLHSEGFSFSFQILTKKYVYNYSSCEIIYHLVDEDKDVYYQICWEEMK